MKHKAKQIIYTILYITLIIFFCFECMKDGTESTKSSSFVVSIIADFLNFFGCKIIIDDHFTMLVRKIVGHFMYFMILGIISSLLWLSINHLKYIYKVIIHFSSGFIFAFCSEFLLEGHTAGRSAQMNDVWIDYGGFISISIIIFISVYVIKKRKEKEDSIN